MTQLNMTGEGGQGWRAAETGRGAGADEQRQCLEVIEEETEEERQAQRKLFTERAERQHYLTFTVTAGRKFFLFQYFKKVRDGRIVTMISDR